MIQIRVSYSITSKITTTITAPRRKSYSTACFLKLQFFNNNIGRTSRSDFSGYYHCFNKINIIAKKQHLYHQQQQRYNFCNSSSNPLLLLGGYSFPMVSSDRKSCDFSSCPNIKEEEEEEDDLNNNLIYSTMIYSNNNSKNNNTKKTKKNRSDNTHSEREVMTDVEELHSMACSNGEKTYIDPATGFTVFTEVCHLQRGKCCGARCRHCPYGWENVRNQNRNAAVSSGDKESIQNLLNQYTSKENTAITNTNNVKKKNTSGNHPSSSSSSAAVSTAAAAAEAVSASISTVEANASITTTTTTTATTPRVEQKMKKSFINSKNKKNVPYTRRGDKGTSQLFTGERRSKSDVVFEALGTIDELTSVIGVAHAQLLELQQKNMNNGADIDCLEELPEWLLEIMSRLFDIGSLVAKPKKTRIRKQRDNDSDDDDSSSSSWSSSGEEEKEEMDETDKILQYNIEEVEQWINTMTEDMPECTHFVLPTGTVLSAQFHVARCVCRRAERVTVAACCSHDEGQQGQQIPSSPYLVGYLNRLSDFLFTAARYCNYCQQVEEIEYRRPKKTNMDDTNCKKNDNNSTTNSSTSQRIRHVVSVRKEK